MMIDQKKLNDLREDIWFNDRGVYVENMLEEPEKYADWDSLIDTFSLPHLGNHLYLNKTENIGELVNVVNIKNDTQIEKQNLVTEEVKKEVDNFNSSPCTSAQELLENNHTFIVTNWEDFNENAKKLIHQLLDTFYVDYVNFGIWPAQISEYSGHAHLYAGLKDSNSFSPHCDIPSNFIFQIDGESEVTIYENKACQLLDHLLDADWSDEQRKELFDSFNIQLQVTMKPGDMVYIPTRQFHYFKPLTNRLSISYPLIFRSPFEGML